ncbi:MAG: T9SS type A sorting domain-containing protein, partial [Bacteroidales bacterium]|nr:T9SS type A sorting domain-containing protein [Bacteroidales bacterium]
SAKSGTISHMESSILHITVDVAVNDQISFFRKVSSEENYDYLKFYIDGILKDEWAGEVPWGEVSFDVTAGQHTFKWEYYKDISESYGSDCGWVDYIIFPPFETGPAVLTVNASATPAEICEGETSQLFAFASGGSGNYTFEWTPQTGLSDPNALDPTASPTATTNYSVTVDDGNTTATSSVTLTVNPVPETPVINQENNSLVSSAAEGNQWYDSSGPVSSATGQVFYPAYTDDFYVIVTNASGCESEQSNIIHFIFTGISELSNGEMINIYPNPFTDNLIIDYTIKSRSDITITLLNTYGQVMQMITDVSNQKPGKSRIVVGDLDMQPGLYLIRINTGEYTVTKRIIRK